MNGVLDSLGFLFVLFGEVGLVVSMVSIVIRVGMDLAERYSENVALVWIFAMSCLFVAVGGLLAGVIP